MKKIITIVFFFFSIITAFSQQEAQFSQNMFNNMAINPGYAGLNDAICATLLIRQQWLGFKDQYKDASGVTHNNNGWPQTNLFSGDGNIKPIKGGVGLTIFQDQLGFEKNLGVKLSYSYHLTIKQGKLGIGAQIGFLNKKIDFSKFNPIDPSDPLLISSKVEGNMATDFAIGLFYKIESKLYFGLSASQLRQAKISYSSLLATPELARHYYLSAGYYYAINPNLELEPSLLIKSDLASTQFDVNALLKWKDQFWGGLSWRPTDAIVALLGYQRPLKNGTLRVGYSYDITTSAMGANGRSSGSHEVMLGYCFKIIKVTHEESYRNTRFL
jgi:type IX secretion system PorP/SprF family membrane protein